MSNSKLVSYTNLSPNHSGKRTHAIDRITPHCVVGQLSCESICGCFTSPARQASCNYGIGSDGRISLCVDEGNRSWCSASNANDQRAVTIECSSDMHAPYAMNHNVYQSLINLCTDICKRNNKKKLLWFNDKNRSLNYKPKPDEMVLTVHRWFSATACPGDWLYNRLGDLAAKVTANLNPSQSANTGTLYRVQVGAYKQRTNAEAMIRRLSSLGVKAIVVSTNNLYKVQAGAYREKANAEKMVTRLKVNNINAFITTQGGQQVEVPKRKTIDELAYEVKIGKWGNGAERKRRLTEEGYDYYAVQKRVNELY